MMSNTYAQNISVLISAYDPFGSSSGNNAQIVAKKVVQEFEKNHPEYQIKFCQLSTVYELASEQLIDCYHSMNLKPKLILSLGEGNSKEIQLETRGHNLDRAVSADNNGEVRRNQIISKDGLAELGTSLSWNKAYCELSRGAKKKFVLSNDPGNFVCNNTIYRMRMLLPEVIYGFAHIPSYTRRFNSGKVKSSTKALTQLILKLIESKQESSFSYPTTKKEVESLMNQNSSLCEQNLLRGLLKRY